VRIGTKSILFGAHCFLLHPWFVAAAWCKIYGFPWDPRLWVAFFVHDLGYIGKPNMDGPEGERHVELGARIMTLMFDRKPKSYLDQLIVWEVPDATSKKFWFCGRWGRLCLLHSRFWAKKLSTRPSKLCVADKLAIALTPGWLYLPMATATGEIREYMKLAKAGEQGKYEHMKFSTDSAKKWYSDAQDYLRRWAYEHKDGRADTWTTKLKRA